MQPDVISLPSNLSDHKQSGPIEVFQLSMFSSVIFLYPRLPTVGTSRTTLPLRYREWRRYGSSCQYFSVLQRRTESTSTCSLSPIPFQPSPNPGCSHFLVSVSAFSFHYSSNSGGQDSPFCTLPSSKLATFAFSPPRPLASTVTSRTRPLGIRSSPYQALPRFRRKCESPVLTRILLSRVFLRQ